MTIYASTLFFDKGQPFAYIVRALRFLVYTPPAWVRTLDGRVWCYKEERLREFPPFRFVNPDRHLANPDLETLLRDGTL